MESFLIYNIMENKFKIIIDILFKNKTYIELKQTECLSILGRVIATEPEFKTDDEYYKEALIEAINNKDVMPFIKKWKIEDYNNCDLKIGYKTKAYTVEIKLTN